MAQPAPCFAPPAPTLIGIVGQISAVTPPAMHTVRAGLPLALSHVVGKAIEKDPNDRFPSARAMRECLRALPFDARAAFVLPESTLDIT